MKYHTLINLPFKILIIIKKDGIAALIEVIQKNSGLLKWKVANYLFDKRWGIDTRGSIQPTQLDIDDSHTDHIKHGVRYEPTPTKIFLALLGNLYINWSNYTFIDFGSGKGRILLLASHFQFKNIVGVEYARDLHNIANVNIANYKHKKQKCLSIKSINLDATKFNVPRGPCVFYFFQPFSNIVMQTVLNNIKATWDKYQNHFIIVLFHPHPFAVEIIENMNVFKCIKVNSLPNAWENIYPKEALIFSSKNEK